MNLLSRWNQSFSNLSVRRKLNLLTVLIALGVIALSVVAALGHRQKALPFGHGAVHVVEAGVTLHDSYHCSRYNTNTGRLTEAMFHAVFQRALAIRDGTQ